MKKSILFFIVLTVALAATIVYASAPDKSQKDLPLAVIIKISGNDLIMDCAEKVTLTFFSTELGHHVTYETDYNGGDQYGFCLRDYTGTLCPGIVTSCNEIIACECKQGSWSAGESVTLRISVKTLQN